VTSTISEFLPAGGNRSHDHDGKPGPDAQPTAWNDGRGRRGPDVSPHLGAGPCGEPSAIDQASRHR
jgi:hypothetical protein